MSNSESFAARWSRLKREEQRQHGKVAEVPVGPRSAAFAKPSTPGGEAEAPQRTDSPEVPFDVKTLPPIDSIVAGSDIKAFLQSGVPAELTRAALRRAWSTDPAISNFIGLAENQWDFTDPTTIPGFGTLEATDDMRRGVAQVMGRLTDPSEVPAEQSLTAASQSTQAASDAPFPDASTSAKADSAAQNNACREQGEEPQEDPHNCAHAAMQQTLPLEKTGDSHSRRTHGSALPK
jgi:hypothetical protein